MLHRSIILLAKYGIYIHSAHEILLARALIAARAADATARDTPNLGGRLDEVSRLCTVNAKYSVLGTLANLLRLHIAGKAPRKRFGSIATVKTIPASAYLKSARTAADSDWRTTCRAFGIPSPTPTPHEEKSYDPVCPTGDKRFQLLFSQHSQESTLFLARWGAVPRTSFVVATDGGDLGAACIVTIPPNTYGMPTHCLDAPVPPETVFTKVLSVPGRTGNVDASCFETEAQGVLTELHLRQFIALGPTVIDNQSVLDLATALEPAPIRQLVCAGRPALHRALSAAKLNVMRSNVIAIVPLLDRASDNAALSRKFFADLPQSVRPARDPVHYFLPRSELHVYVKIKSHQEEPHPSEGPAPCYQLFFANAIADKAATLGTQRAALDPLPNVIIPPFRGPFFLVHHGEMVNCRLSRYVHRQLHIDSHTHMSDLAARKQYALPSLCTPHIHPAARNVLAFPDFSDTPTQFGAEIGDLADLTAPAPASPSAVQLDPAPPTPEPEPVITLPIQSLLLSHAFQLGGSWHHILRESRASNLRIVWPTCPFVESDTPIEDCCPLCLPQRLLGNAQHYRSLQCTNSGVRTAVHAVFRAVEACLTRLAPPAAWIKHSTPYYSPVLPPALCETYPTLAGIGWLLCNTLSDPEVPLHDLVADLSVTTMHLGMLSCTLPLSLMYKPLQALEDHEVHEIESTKVKALHALKQTVHTQLRSALKSMTSPTSQDTLTPPIPTTSQKHTIPTACSEPLCLRQTADPRQMLCTTHLHSRRTEYLSTYIAKRLCSLQAPHNQFGRFTSLNVMHAFTNPSADGGCFSALMTQAARSHTTTPEGAHLFPASYTPTLPLIQAVLTTLHVPYVCTDAEISTSRSRWNGCSQHRPLCLCDGNPSPHYRRTLTAPTANVCQDCRCIRIISPLLTTDPLYTTCSACANEIPPDQARRPCAHCGLCVHDPDIHKCPAANTWLAHLSLEVCCPKCRLLIATGQAALRQPTHTLASVQLQNRAPKHKQKLKQKHTPVTSSRNSNTSNALTIATTTITTTTNTSTGTANNTTNTTPRALKRSRETTQPEAMRQDSTCLQAWLGDATGYTPPQLPPAARDTLRRIHAGPEAARRSCRVS